MNSEIETRAGDRGSVEESLAELEAVIASLGDGLVVFGRHGEIRRVNQAAQKILAMNPSTPMTSLEEMLHRLRPTSSDGQPFVLGESPLSCMLNQGEAVLGVTAVVSSRQGEDIWVSVNAAPVRGRDGTILGAAVTFRDVTNRLEAERGLSRLAAIVESSSNAIIAKNLDGIITDWNPAAEELYGYTAAEIRGKHISMLVPPDREDELKRMLEAVRRGERMSEVESVRVAKDGTRIDVSVTLAPLRDSEGRLFGASSIVRDISERKRAEEALRLSEERLRLLTAHSPDTMFHQDVNLRYTWIVGQHVTGKGVGKTDYDLMGRDAAEYVQAVKQRVIQTGEGTRAEVRDLLYGKEYYFDAVYQPSRDAEGRIDGLFGYVRDITERKLTEKTLESNEARFRAIFEEAGIGMAEVDLETGRIVRSNRALREMFGRTAEELRLVPFAEYTHPDDLAEDLRLATELKLGQRNSYQLEKRYLHKDGRIIWGRLSATLCRGTQGQPDFAIGMIEDISERKRLEQQLMRAQRLETAGRVAGQVAHDFNNLLGPIVAYPEMIKMELPENHVVAEYCDDMEDAARTMARINEEMLVLSRRGLTEKEAVDLNRLVRQVVEMIPGGLETLEIKLDLEEMLLPAAGMSSQLLRVVLNLVNNAREAMSDAGCLRIRTENFYVFQPFGRYNRVEAGEYVKLTVSDSGCGIPSNVLDRIFDAFFTTKKTDGRRGSGLGLSVVQAVVDDHCGYIDVETAVGKGTTFYIYLPVHREQSIIRTEQARTRGSGTILVVDDDPLQQKVICRVAETLGYEVASVESGEQALDLLRRKPADLLVLDMVMDGMDGAETYREVLKIRPGQRVVIMSGYAETERMDEARRLGAEQFIRKPVTVAELSEALRTGLSAR